MLLPAKALKDELGGERRSAVSIQELVHLKEHYGISIQAAMARSPIEKLQQEMVSGG